MPIYVSWFKVSVSQLYRVTYKSDISEISFTLSNHLFSWIEENINSNARHVILINPTKLATWAVETVYI